MNNAIQLATLLAVVALSTMQSKDYIITVNDVAQDIGLDQDTELVLPDGTSLTVSLHQKEYVQFAGDQFRFEHKSQYKPNRSDLGDGIFQTMIVTPIGTGILIQEYTTMNPSGLVNMMMSELTKEEVEYGYEYKEKPVTREVGGVVASGKQAVTTYLDTEWTREVLAYGEKDRGVLVITFIEKQEHATEKGLIEHLWKTLKFD